MPQPEYLEPNAYSFDAPPKLEQARAWAGVVLIHGCPGSAAETRPMGEFLAAQGMSVRCPLLPGHGTTPEALMRIRWQAWAEEVKAAFDDLQARCSEVFVGGLSLGGLLTLWLGIEKPEIAGLIPMAPAVKVRNRLAPLSLGLRHFLKYSPFGAVGDDDLADPEAIERIWCYDELPLWGAGEVILLQREVVKNLPRIKQPVLIFQGRRDAQVPPQSAELVYDTVSSVDKTLVWLENSGHNLLADGERELVWSRSYAWMLERVKSGTR